MIWKDLLPFPPLKGPPVPRWFLHHSNELTARQIEVVKYKISGYTMREIAEILGISEEEVKTDLGNAYKAMGVGKLNALFRECISKKYFTIEDLPFKEE